MLLVKTELKQSPIHGFGLFAAEWIPKNTTVWCLALAFDKIVDCPLISAVAREFLQKYAYRDKYSNDLILCSDDARFINHSETPNLKPGSWSSLSYGCDIALRDIRIGEEITIDYRLIDASFTGV